MPEEVASKHLQKALDQQERVEFYLMAVGFLSNEWTVALGELGVDHPQSTTTLLLTMIWENICDPIWMAQNNILHSVQNPVSTDEASSLRDRMHWYQRHQSEVLDYRHRFLADFTESDLLKWKRSTLRAQVE